MLSFVKDQCSICYDVAANIKTRFKYACWAELIWR